ncbi:hypothetical protein MTR67_003591 [Solanum verrucosum]|uniref:Uncharacterized protein n=1 Tax=Solanum verrucosum TaxID=315347 RepID=A0AAF0T9G9_SOLVR|nr:hypothetical protein MTR67_003591 [Solanum verrucosum]
MINFLRSSKNYMFCFCSSAVISSGPLAFSKIQAYSVLAFFNEGKRSQQRTIVMWRSLDANKFFNLLHKSVLCCFLYCSSLS